MSTPLSRAISSSTGAVNTPSASLPCAAVVGRLAFAERDAAGEVARLRRAAGEDEVAEAGQAHQRLGLGAAGAAEAHQLGEAARRQRGRARWRPGRAR